MVGHRPRPTHATAGPERAAAWGGSAVRPRVGTSESFSGFDEGEAPTEPGEFDGFGGDESPIMEGSGAAEPFEQAMI